MDAAWPVQELETLGACPICGSSARSLAYRDLRDQVYFCAVGDGQPGHVTRAMSSMSTLAPRRNRFTPLMPTISRMARHPLPSQANS